MIPERTISLRGRYTFTGFSSYAAPPEGPEGNHHAMLQNARTGGRVYLPRHVLRNRGEGSYHWGSTLHNDRSGTTRPSR